MRSAIGTYGKERARAMRARRLSRSPRGCAAVSLSVVLSLALAGCGGGGAGAVSSPANVGPQSIAFTSPSIGGNEASAVGRTIPARYTCDGSDTVPAFRWGPVPSNTAELALFLFKVNRTIQKGRGANVEVSVEWALTGVSPSVHATLAGKLPRGAVAGRYSICPTKGKTGTYIFQLNAVSRRLVVGPRLTPGGVYQKAEGSTVASGTLVSSYKRA